MSVGGPLIAVVMPAFNAETTIVQAIKSVMVQTHRNVELIVCDDASTDKTTEMVCGFDDKRIRLLRNMSNVGEGISRDRAIEKANGEWLAVLDADDAWHPRRLEALLAVAGKDTDRMVFDDIVECHHQSAGLIPWRRMRGSEAYGAHGFPVDVPAFEWIRSRRLLIKPLIPAAALRTCGVTHSERRFAEDTEFFLNLVANGLKLRYFPEAYYYYRIYPGSMSSARSRSVQMRGVLENAIILFKNNPSMVESLRKRIRIERRNEVYSEFMWFLKDHHLSDAVGYASSHPWVFAELFNRVTREVPYHVHRLWHHGSGRNSS